MIELFYKYKREPLIAINILDNDSCEGCFFWNLPKNEFGQICKKIKKYK